MAFCNKCGTQLSDGDNFCPHCGTPINEGDVYCMECVKKIDEAPTSITKQPKCPHCGSFVNEGDVYCMECGKVISEKPTSIESDIVKEETPPLPKCGNKTNNGFVEQQPESQFSKDIVWENNITNDGNGTIEDNNASLDNPIENNEIGNAEVEKNINNQDAEPRLGNKYKSVIWGILAVLLLVGCWWCYESANQRAAREKAIADSLEIARQDSIKLEKARQDSIKQEKARQDSIEQAIEEERKREEAEKFIKDSYIKIINDAADNPDQLGGQYYFLFDITQDDIPELWIQYEDEEGYSFAVYTVTNGALSRLFKGIAGLPAHHSFHIGNDYVLFNFGTYGSARWTKYKYSNGKIIEQIVFTGNDGYTKCPEPEANTYELTNTEPIESIKIEKYKDFQPSSNQNNLDWLQGHWVYEQGNYKSHLEISGNTIKTYSSMNPSPEIATFTIVGDELTANTKGMATVVKIDFNNHRIDWGDGHWMYKVSSGSSKSYSNTIHSSNSQQRQRPFLDGQDIMARLYNQRFRHSSGLEIRIDGYGRIEIDGDAAGVLSVLRYSSENALLRYGNGLYGEGKILLQISGDKLLLKDPVDGSVFYQR